MNTDEDYVIAIRLEYKKLNSYNSYYEEREYCGIEKQAKCLSGSERVHPVPDSDSLREPGPATPHSLFH